MMGNQDYLSGGCDMGWCADLPGKLCYEGGGGGGGAGSETKTVCQTVSNEVNTKMQLSIQCSACGTINISKYVNIFLSTNPTTFILSSRFTDGWLYRIYPKYSDTVNVRTPSFFLKRHLFNVPYISGHPPNRVFLPSVNVRTQKTCPLFLVKLLFFTTGIFCIFALFTCVSG